jgi:hypothetical protein
MVIPEELRAKGWYLSLEGHAARWLFGFCGWSLRLVSWGFGVQAWQMHALEVCSPSGVLHVRLGVISHDTMRPLFGWRFYGSENGESGWMTFGFRVDVFGVAVRVWRDGGEASYLT